MPVRLSISLIAWLAGCYWASIDRNALAVLSLSIATLVHLSTESSTRSQSSKYDSKVSIFSIAILAFGGFLGVIVGPTKEPQLWLAAKPYFYSALAIAACIFIGREYFRKADVEDEPP